MHGAEDENADEQEVRELEEAVVAPPYEVDRRDPHRQPAQEGHPPHGDVDPVVMFLRGGVDRLADGVRPPVVPHPVDHEEEGVDRHSGEG